LRGDERTSGRVVAERRLAMIVMIMTMRVAVIVVVTPVVAKIVTMIVTMAMMRLLVRAVFRIERRLDRGKLRAETAKHVLDHVVAADAQPLAGDLQVDVAVADVPGEPRQFVGIGRRDLDQRLGPADNPHHGAVVEDEAVAVMQGRRLRQIEQKPGAALAGQDDAAAMAVVGVERDLVDRAGAVPKARGFDGLRALHRQSSARS
jgi:hypothetical protein